MSSMPEGSDLVVPVRSSAQDGEQLESIATIGAPDDVTLDDHATLEVARRLPVTRSRECSFDDRH